MIKIRHITNNTYSVCERCGNRWDWDWEILFTGTLVECESYIRLYKDGYI